MYACVYACMYVCTFKENIAPTERELQIQVYMHLMHVCNVCMYVCTNLQGEHRTYGKRAANSGIYVSNVCMHACMYVCMYKPPRRTSLLRKESCKFRYICMRACMYACMCIDSHIANSYTVCTLIHTYIHAYMHKICPLCAA
jgi:hypothetical protein